MLKIKVMLNSDSIRKLSNFKAQSVKFKVFISIFETY